MSNIENQENTYITSTPITKQNLSIAEKVKRIIVANNLHPIIIGYSAIYPELEVLFYHQNYQRNKIIKEESYSPDNANLMIVHGNINRKLDPYLKECYQKLHFPKIVVVLGGNLKVQNYTASQVLGSEIPINYFLPGFPPTLIEILDLFKKIKSDVKVGGK